VSDKGDLRVTWKALVVIVTIIFIFAKVVHKVKMTTTLRLLAAIVATTAVCSHALFVGPHGAITMAGRARRRAPVTARDAARPPHADFDVASEGALPRAAALRQLGGSTAALAASWALRPARLSAAQKMMLNEDGEYVELDEASERVRH